MQIIALHDKHWVIGGQNWWGIWRLEDCKMEGNNKSINKNIKMEWTEAGGVGM